MKQLILSKSPLFTQSNVHYLCAENEEINLLTDYQFEKSTPEHISENLPTEIQNQIRELGDSYYTIAIIPQEKVSDFSNKLKAYLKQILDKIIKQQSISDLYLYEVLPDLFQNLAALQDIDQSLKLNDLFQLITEIDTLSPTDTLSSQILF